MTKDLYVIINKRMGKALRDRVYLTEKNGLKEINDYWDKNFILCKFSLVEVRENNEWVNIDDIEQI